jgi:hypothetical protein
VSGAPALTVAATGDCTIAGATDPATTVRAAGALMTLRAELLTV